MKLIFYISLLWAATVQAAEPGQLRMEIVWEAVPGAKTYLLQVAATKNFKEKLLELRVKEPRATVDLKSHPEYYWRVAGVDEDGDLGRFSALQRMDASQILAWQAKQAAIAVAAEKAAKKKEQEAIEKEKERQRVLAALPPEPVRFSEVKVAYGGGWAMQKGSTTSSEIESSGIALNSLRAGWRLEQKPWAMDFNFGFQPWKYISNNPEIALFQSTLSAYRFEFSAYAKQSQSPWYGGLRYRREGELQKTGPETVSIGHLSYWGVVVGMEWTLWKDASSKDDWRLQAQLEGAPIGSRTGFGAQVASLLRLGSFGEDLVPLWEVSAYPYYRKHSLTGRPEWTVEWNTWLWLTYSL